MYFRSHFSYIGNLSRYRPPRQCVTTSPLPPILPSCLTFAKNKDEGEKRGAATLCIRIYPLYIPTLFFSLRRFSLDFSFSSNFTAYSLPFFLYKVHFSPTIANFSHFLAACKGLGCEFSFCLGDERRLRIKT